MRVSALRMAVIAVLPFIALALRSKKINLGRKERGHQFIMPILAVIYSLVSMLAMSKIAVGLIRLTKILINIATLIPAVGESFGSTLNNLYQSFHMGYGIQILCNTILMAVFCTFKHAALPVIRKVWRRWPELYKHTTAIFYKEDGSKCVLKQRYAQMRDMLNILYYTLIILGALTMVLAFFYSDSQAFVFPTYPVFGVIVIGEVIFFLDGKSEDEMSYGEGRESDDMQEVDYNAVLSKMEEKFKERIFLADQMPQPEKEKKSYNWEDEFENEDSLSQITGSYFQAMKKSGEKLNPDYISASNQLLHHQSVLIYNPFYKDLSAYLYLPIFHELLNNHSVLFICGRITSENQVKEWITSIVQEATNLPKLWKIESLGENTVGEEMPDIGILGFRKLYDLNSIRANEKFYQRATLIILLEPSNLLGTGQVGLRSVLQFCEEENKKITYCALDRNVDGLVDALSHAVRQSITEVIAAPVSQTAYCRGFWQAEGPGVQNRILPRISHYLGFGGEIGSFGMHEGVHNIHWFSGSKMPLLDLRWIVQQYYPCICQYIHSPNEQRLLDERFQFHEDLWQAEIMPEAFILVEDEFSNLFEVSRMFGSRIQEKGIVNILSENYLLRDYMIANETLFTNDPKAIPSIVPDYARTERNFVLRTLMLMSAKPIDENELSRELALHGNSTLKSYDRLIMLIERYTGVKNVQIHTQKEDVWVGGRICSRFSYSVDLKSVEDIFESALKSAYYVVENEQTNRYLMGKRLMGHIEQVLLPGQFFCYDGKYYQVRSISPENGIIVRRSADHLNGRLCYRQLRTYSIKDSVTVDVGRNLRGIKLQSCFGNVKVQTDGYLEMKSRNALNNAVLVQLEKIVHRKMVYKEFLQIDIPDTTDEVRYTLCVLLNELFYTIFPNEASYLKAVCGYIPEHIVKSKDYQYMIRSIVPELKYDSQENSYIYIIEDSTLDLGLMVSVERNFQRIMEIAADYLDWYMNTTEDETDEENSQAFISKNVVEDVGGEDEEVLGGNVNNQTKTKKYLMFGYAQEPEWLSLRETLEYLMAHQFNDSNLQNTRKAEGTFDDGYVYDPNQPGQHYCDFCGKPLESGQYTVLKDGRERCPECSKDAIKTKKQFQQTYKETLKEMEEIFDIQLDYKIKVRMVNARKINEPFGEYQPGPKFDCRVLGYASGGKKIMIENGAPKWKTKSTLVHELTHIWQHHNWDQNFLNQYGKNEDCNLTMEGMAVWAEVQYLVSMGEKERAVMYKRNREYDTSIYGVGMKKFLKKYPIKEKGQIKKSKSPFGKIPKIKK